MIAEPAWFLLAATVVSAAPERRTGPTSNDNVHVVGFYRHISGSKPKLIVHARLGCSIYHRTWHKVITCTEACV